MNSAYRRQCIYAHICTRIRRGRIRSRILPIFVNFKEMFFNYINIFLHYFVKPFINHQLNMCKILKIYIPCKQHRFCSPQSRHIFAKNDGGIGVISISRYIQKKIYIYKIYVGWKMSFAEGYRLGSLLDVSSSVLSPFSFSPRPTSDLGEWNKFHVSEKLESLGGVEDIFLGPPENSLFRVICFSIKVGYRRGRDER